MKRFALVLAVLLLPGCYHATIETGRPPSPQQIDIPWAHGFVYGLVPPNTVQAQQQCSSGVARVETEHSFLNMLAQGLTFGLYTPIHITVTCASGEEQQDGALPTVSTREEFEAALASGEPFLVPLR